VLSVCLAHAGAKNGRSGLIQKWEVSNPFLLKDKSRIQTQRVATITVNLHRFIVSSESSLAGWRFNISLLLTIKGRYPSGVSSIVIMTQVSASLSRSAIIKLLQKKTKFISMEVRDEESKAQARDEESSDQAVVVNALYKKHRRPEAKSVRGFKLLVRAARTQGVDREVLDMNPSR
jgi:hypothetical protein